MERPKFKAFVTPIAEARWAWIDKPNTKFKELGEYSVEELLRVDDDATMPFIEKLQEMTDKVKEWAEEELQKMIKEKPKLKKALRPMEEYHAWEEDIDDEGEDTGFIKVKFKKAATYKDKKTGKIVKNKINVFDAKGKLIKVPVAVGNGSQICVECYPSPFLSITNNIPSYGLSLKLNKIQIIVLEEFGNDASNSFAVVEDGWDGADYEPEENDEAVSQDAGEPVEEGEEEAGDF